jgi:hypothetical protein
MDEDPATLRAHALLFEKMARPTGATEAASRALRYIADQIEQRNFVDTNENDINEVDLVTPGKLAATG